MLFRPEQHEKKKKDRWARNAGIRPCRRTKTETLRRREWGRSVGAKCFRGAWRKDHFVGVSCGRCREDLRVSADWVVGWRAWHVLVGYERGCLWFWEIGFGAWVGYRAVIYIGARSVVRGVIWLGDDVYLKSALGILTVRARG